MCDAVKKYAKKYAKEYVKKQAKIAFEQGKLEGMLEGKLEGMLETNVLSVKNIMKNLKLDINGAFDVLGIPEADQDQIKMCLSKES